MANNYKKIILSGGWGYGNLGDDAILLSSYNLIKNRFPNSDIIILSYNIRQSSLVIPESENIRYYDSLHVSMYGYKPNVLSFGEGLLPELWKPIKSRYNKKVIKRIRDSKLRNKVIKNKEEFKEQYRKQFQEFSDICRESDMYIMCGGGYLTGWAEMITSKYFEVEIAKKNIMSSGLSGKIDVRLSDGFDALEAGESDAVIIAGMGGNLIIDILKRGLHKMSAGYELVLSPQSDVPLVRSFLREYGFVIKDEEMLVEDGKYYNIIKAELSETGLNTETEKKKNDSAEDKQLILNDTYGEKLIEKKQSGKQGQRETKGNKNEIRKRKTYRNRYCGQDTYFLQR